MNKNSFDLDKELRNSKSSIDLNKINPSLSSTIYSRSLNEKPSKATVPFLKSKLFKIGAPILGVSILTIVLAPIIYISTLKYTNNMAGSAASINVVTSSNSQETSPETAKKCYIDYSLPSSIKKDALTFDLSILLGHDEKTNIVLNDGSKINKDNSSDFTFKVKISSLEANIDNDILTISDFMSSDYDVNTSTNNDFFKQSSIVSLNTSDYVLISKLTLTYKLSLVVTNKEKTIFTLATTNFKYEISTDNIYFK
jgi:hypothetical protein